MIDKTPYIWYNYYDGRILIREGSATTTSSLTLLWEVLKMGSIYSITNKTNGKRYIGLTNNVEDRFRRHKYRLKNNKHGNDYLQNAWNKYGKENFEFEILEENIERNKLGSKEQIYIRKYDSFNKGYNLTTGGEKSYEMAESTKWKLHFANAGNSLDDKARKKIARAKSKITEKRGKEIYKKYRKKYFNDEITIKEIVEAENLSKWIISKIVEHDHWTVRDIKEKIAINEEAFKKY